MNVTSRKVLTQAALKDAGCSLPNCRHDHTRLYIHQCCHPDADLDALYDKSTGELTLSCALCGMRVMAFLIAEGG